MFCDEVDISLGGVKLKVRRLTVAEIRQARLAWQTGAETAIDEAYTKLLESHVTLDDGSKLDPTQLSLPQTQKLVAELVGIPEGSGISDFIGLLC